MVSLLKKVVTWHCFNSTATVRNPTRQRNLEQQYTKHVTAQLDLGIFIKQNIHSSIVRILYLCILLLMNMYQD